VRTVATGADPFALALEQVRSADLRAEIEIDEAPAPQRLAPSAVALTAELSEPHTDAATGRFVLLHDPDGVDEWEGSFRSVVFVRASLEADLVDDPLLYDVGWTWVEEALAERGCRYTQLGGTVTRTSGRSFGTMGERPPDGFVEIRASWTPLEAEDGSVLDDMGAHVGAWADLMAQAAGLPPLPSGVAQVAAQRRRSRQ
jgi:hypothetical protein